MKYLIILTLVLITTSCTTNNNGNITADYNSNLSRFSHYHAGLMDTVITIVGYAASESEFNYYVNEMVQKFTYLHNLFTTFDEVEGLTNMYTVNSMAGIQPVEVDDLIIQLLQLSKEMYIYTNGALNIALGPVLEIWHNHRTMQNSTVPTMEVLHYANQFTNINHLIINEEYNTVFLQHPNMSLDVGTVAKGLAIDIVANMAYDMGLEHFLISVGGDVKTMNAPPNATTWVTGIQNPRSPQNNDLIDIVRVQNLSVFTSGDYERYFIVDDTRYNHIVDPTTLMPSQNFISVTVIHEDSLIAEVLSTSLFIKDLHAGQELLQKLGGYAMWVLPDESVVVSPNYGQFSDNFS